ncbi:MAG TPA: FAD/NAD(P)-binding oxidoreductase [Terriglobales bacterium]|nr:FAD/NAD(P)-binding oxidoreductase [Terriglobales bacterium]
MSDRRQFDVLVVGGGPAGIAAACCAAEAALRVAVADDNSALGGQIWRGEHSSPSSKEAESWYQRVKDLRVEHLPGTRVFAQADSHTLLAETDSSVCEFSFRSLIIATGARERFLPFPGWTLPNVMGAGGLQALAKSGWNVRGRKVVVAGTGPLLLAVAAHLKEYGAKVRLIAEQASQRQLLLFALGLCRQPSKLKDALSLRRQLLGVPYLNGCWPVAAEGKQKLETVTLRRGAKTWCVSCDYLACGFHLVPNTELAALLGCAIENGKVRVDDLQQTTLPNVYCAGEPTGIGGLELSLLEGQIAGYSAAGQRDSARRLFANRNKMRGFAAALERAFALRPELKELPRPETLVCRCEDVSLSRLREHSSWRAAKLLTRCGMGPCQSRVCGPALEFLLDWKPDSVRPPVFPVRVESLIAASRTDSETLHNAALRS